MKKKIFYYMLIAFGIILLACFFNNKSIYLLPKIELIKYQRKTVITKKIDYQDFGYIKGLMFVQDSDFSKLFYLRGTFLEPQTIFTSTNKFTPLGFSKDEKLFAYATPKYNSDTTTSFEITVISANGDENQFELTTGDFISDLPVGHDFVGIKNIKSKWVNNEIIYVVLYSQNQFQNTSGFVEEFPASFNATQQKWNDYYLNLPNRRITQSVSFSNDMSYVLYEENGLVLRDIKNKENIWKNEDINFFYDMLTSWKSDGSRIAVGSEFQQYDEIPIYLISTKGESATVPNENHLFSGFLLMDIAWSPSDNFLAILGRKGDNLIIFIYDEKLNKIDQYLDLGSIDGIANLMWSPDSQYIAISNINSTIKLVKLSSNKIIDLKVDGIVCGWINEFVTDWDGQ